MITGPVKVSQLDLASTLDGTEYFMIVQGGTNKRLPLSTFANFAVKPQSFTGVGPFTVTLGTVQSFLWCYINGVYNESSAFTRVGQVFTYANAATQPLTVASKVIIVFQGA